MSEQSHQQRETSRASQQKAPAEQEHLGSLTVEDDPDGTVDPADLAGTAAPGDAEFGPSANEATGH